MPEFADFIFILMAFWMLAFILRNPTCRTIARG